eukprot:CAMPEP_0116126296 /NCGR_PEP_ID=MMETSP0329-20121206/6260_1 /TAXON_ID=697910 /ORGANISM="Pseudo-nitzschia arenysensis, Strain B593" /LENGTH=328 /DNA_ID=CAMNT_0003620377 /DNA_START=84 /DNA_END=1070 /DNA_ORIENTATION=+
MKTVPIIAWITSLTLVASVATDWIMTEELYAVNHTTSKHSLGDFGSTHLRSGSKVMYSLPPVLLIGVQKGGTTAIANWLFEGGYRRSRVFDNEPFFAGKEPHFFDHEEEYEKGIEFYASRYETNPGEYAGPALDATPATFQNPGRVFETYSKAGANQINELKMIVILRDPVARELSLYNHKVNGFLTNPVKGEWYMAVGREDGSVISFDEYVDKLYHKNYTSYYARHLSKWFNLFKRQQILVLAYEELKQDEKTARQRIVDFLGHDIPGESRVLNDKSSKKKLKKPSPEAREKLLHHLRPQYEELYRLLEENPGPPMEQKPFPRFPVD